MTSHPSSVTPSLPPGLTAAEVAKSRHEFGDNVLQPPARDPWWKLLLQKFDDPIIRILIIAALIAIGVGVPHGEYLEGIGIVIAILLATTLAFLNEYKAHREFDILNQVNDDVAIKVIRDGGFTTVPRKEIVVGDRVLLEAGEEVPADGRLCEATSLQINESGLTGESEPRRKVSRVVAGEEPAGKPTYPVDMVLRGCVVLDGHGMFEVTAVGDRTEIGKTVRAAAEDTGAATPLNHQLSQLSKVIGVVGLLVAAATFTSLVVRGAWVGDLALNAQQWVVMAILGLGVATALSPVWLPMVFDALELACAIPAPAWLGRGGEGGAARRWLTVGAIGLAWVCLALAAGFTTGWIPASPSDWLPADAATRLIAYFMVAVTLIVVAVPEGLAMSVTLSLAYSMRRMTAANTLVRHMHACETIGAATVICADKTGTLTKNEMRVFAVRFPALDAQLDPQRDVDALIVENICCNTTAHLGRDGSEATRVLGNPTEGALLLWLDEQGVEYIAHRHAFSVTYQVTFSTQRKWMGTFGVSPQTGQARFHIKGAPELVLERATRVCVPGGIEPMAAHRRRIEEELLGFQRRGMRTLALAYHEGVPYEEGTDIESAVGNLVWLGFVAIADPVRADAPAAVAACRRAGIQVKMVTGDNPATAEEIARQIGLWESGDTAQGHLTGPAFQPLPDEEARQAAARLKILSRAKPLDKVRLVRSLQAAGEVVAVTGDGINDCAALNHADVGLAMGRSGTSAAKEASDMVLLDDSFATIVNAVMWGRSLYENIQRFLLFQLTINVAALGIVFLGPFIGVELSLTVIQMLWVNLVMDTLAALALATEPPHPEVLQRPPRSPGAFIVTRPMAVNLFATAAAFLVVSLVLLRLMRRDGTVPPTSFRCSSPSSCCFSSGTCSTRGAWACPNPRCADWGRTACFWRSRPRSCWDSL
jgi:P-type Ca2+ transporter type 2C